MGLVMWIDQNLIVIDLVERIFKQNQIVFYSVSDVKNFGYLIDDLKPEVIVLDCETAVKNYDSLKIQFMALQALKSTSIILLGDCECPDYVTSIGRIGKPFDPFEIPSRIAQIIEAK